MYTLYAIKKDLPTLPHQIKDKSFLIAVPEFYTSVQTRHICFPSHIFLTQIKKNIVYFLLSMLVWNDMFSFVRQNSCSPSVPLREVWLNVDICKVWGDLVASAQLHLLLICKLVLWVCYISIMVSLTISSHHVTFRAHSQRPSAPSFADRYMNPNAEPMHPGPCNYPSIHVKCGCERESVKPMCIH